jgi:uncharacterized protein (DUF433 family)
MEDTGMWEERIDRDPGILSGKPIIKGTRISVEFLLNLLSSGWSYEEVLENYPQLSRESILATLEYAWKLVDQETESSIPARPQ